MERPLEVLEKSMNFTHTCLYEPWCSYLGKQCRFDLVIRTDPDENLKKKYDFVFCFQFPKDLFKENVTDEISYEDNGLPVKVRIFP